MKILTIFIVFGSLIVGCGQSDRADISALTTHDRILFSAAAAHENVDVTTNGSPWDWKVRYNNNLKKEGYAEYSIIPGINLCTISLNVNNMVACEVGGWNRRFFIVSRHEIKHCKGRGHSKNENNIMYKIVPCWPTNK